MAWIGGLAEWQEGEIVYLSVSFTWKVREAWSRATFARAQGLKPVAGGPAMAFEEMRDIMAPVADVPTKKIFSRRKWHTVGADHPIGTVVQIQNPLATLASRGCSEDCYFCTVPVIEGQQTLLPDFTPRPILCDNNLSALDSKYQDFIIEKYNAHGVKLIDANSGFEPRREAVKSHQHKGEVKMEAAQEQSAGMAGGALGQFNKALSVPTWDGSTPEQRMEMMREEARYLRRMVTDLQSTVRKLQAHQHAHDGSIVVPLRNRDDEDRPRGYFYDPLK